jgi:hypothetical protein
MKTSKLAVLPFTFVAAAVLLGGCVGAEPIEGEEALDTQSQAEEGTAEAASAISTTRCITGSCVTFESYGDHLYVQDTAPDGHSAVGQLWWPNGWPGYTFATCWNPNGAGTVKNCNYNYPEGITIYFRSCLGEYGSQTVLDWTCSIWVPASTAN